MPERDARRRVLRAGTGAGVVAGLSRAGARQVGTALGRAGAAALAALGSRGANAATILAVRVWPAKDYTRVALELDAPLRSTQMQLSDPPRLVVDLEGLEIDLALRDLIAKVQPDDPYILQVRIGQNRPTVARIVLDLRTDVDPQLFTLPPVGNYKYRLVLDLYPVTRIDPLQTLLEDVRRTTGPRASPPVLTPPPAATPATALDDPIVALLQDRLAQPAPGAGSPRAARAGEAPAGALPGAPAPARSAPGALAGAPATPGAVDPLAALTGGGAGHTIPSKRPAGPPRRPGRRIEPPVTRMVTIAIDAGHGGEDPGALGRSGTREKDVVLRIAHLLRERIRAEPGMRPYLTRDGDYFVPLVTRVEKARRVQADLFVSLHADAFVRPSARGASVYVLSERGASSSAARWLANKENASDLIGGVNLNSRDVEVRKVLLDMSTSAQIRDSSVFGSFVLAELGDVGELHKPRIEQAGFAVLKAPDIPSILVETAFISNPEEERRLRDPRYQARVADAILRGIKAWVKRHPPGSRGRTT